MYSAFECHASDFTTRFCVLLNHVMRWVYALWHTFKPSGDLVCETVLLAAYRLRLTPENICLGYREIVQSVFCEGQVCEVVLPSGSSLAIAAHNMQSTGQDAQCVYVSMQLLLSVRP